jgi:hypothetical protein
MPVVKFKKTASSGLKQSRVYIDDELLTFENDIAMRELELDIEYEIYWRMFGNPGATLTVEKEFGGVSKKIVDKSKIPSNRSRKADFTYFKV